MNMAEGVKRDNRRKFLQGTVISDKMNKTRVVQVRWSSKHAKYEKVIRRATKFKAHDENNEYKVGDKVMIESTKPISKEKKFKVLRKA